MRTSKLQPTHIEMDTWVYFTTRPPMNHTFRHAGWTLTVHLSSVCVFLHPCKRMVGDNVPACYTTKGPTVTRMLTHVFGP